MLSVIKDKLWLLADFCRKDFGQALTMIWPSWPKTRRKFKWRIRPFIFVSNCLTRMIWDIFGERGLIKIQPLNMREGTRDSTTRSHPWLIQCLQCPRACRFNWAKFGSVLVETPWSRDTLKLLNIDYLSILSLFLLFSHSDFLRGRSFERKK